MHGKQNLTRSFVLIICAMGVFVLMPAFGQSSPNLRGIAGLQSGSVLFLSIKGDVSGASSLCGTDIYTLDSNVAAAAVHAGVLANGQTGIVAVVICDGLSSYSGSFRNGVQSNSWGSFDLSFRFVRLAQAPGSLAQATPSAPPATQAPPTQPAKPPVASRNLYVFDDPNVLKGNGNFKPGTVIYVQVTGRAAGAKLWGTDIYTSDSDLTGAVVHTGILSDGQTGIVKVTILPGQQSYVGSNRHNVVSLSFGSWAMSYSLEPVTQSYDRVVRMILDPGSADHIPNVTTGNSYVVWVTGSADQRSVWGTDIYTSDSPFATAAVHAGILKVGESGPVIVHVLEGQSHYEGSTRNGVTTKSFGSYGRSYSLEPAR
jgi:hypothetical protein